MVGTLHNKTFSWMWASHKIKSTMEFLNIHGTHKWPCKKGNCIQMNFAEHGLIRCGFKWVNYQVILMTQQESTNKFKPEIHISGCVSKSQPSSHLPIFWEIPFEIFNLRKPASPWRGSALVLFWREAIQFNSLFYYEMWKDMLWLCTSTWQAMDSSVQ